MTQYHALVFSSKSQADSILGDYPEYDGWKSGSVYKVNLPLETSLPSALTTYIRAFEMNPERVYFTNTEVVM